MKTLINESFSLIDKQKFEEFLLSAGILYRYPGSSALTWRPYGLLILNPFSNFLRNLFPKFGYQEHVFPLLANVEDFYKLNQEIYEFDKGVFKFNKLALRPSGEIVIYPIFKDWIHTINDLPIKVFQIGQMFRKGRKSGIFRNNEANFFIEGHSAHSSRREVDAQVSNNGIIIDQVLDYFGLPVIRSERPIWTNKPVAENNFGYDAILPNGEAALAASNYAQMQIFSKVFKIGFYDNDGNYDYTYQSTFGFSFRPFLFSLWILSDAYGLRLLPSIAPNKVVILEVNPKRNQNISNLVNHVKKKVDQLGIEYAYDCDPSSPINKRRAKWEMMGTPLRLEIGARELNSGKLMVKRRDNFGAIDFDLQNLQEVIPSLLGEVEKNLRRKLMDNFLGSQVLATTSLEIIQALTSKKVAKLFICYSHDCINGLQKLVNKGELLGVSKIGHEEKCVFCNHPTYYEGWYARRI